MRRVELLCGYLPRCRVFADVGCDHGYCARYAVKNGLCESAIISDISEKSLQKAEKLLKNYIEEGKVRSVCCDGLEKVSADGVLIAGMGGEEIIRILKNAYIPRAFTLQPMKNARRLRGYLLENGCLLTQDDLFCDGKNYYFVICGEYNPAAVGCAYTEAQLRYGKHSLENPLLREYLKIQLAKKREYLSRGLSAGSRAAVQEEYNFIEGVLKGEIK